MTIVEVVRDLTALQELSKIRDVVKFLPTHG
jgi:hypothetical protein